MQPPVSVYAPCLSFNDTSIVTRRWSTRALGPKLKVCWNICRYPIGTLTTEPEVGRSQAFFMAHWISVTFINIEMAVLWKVSYKTCSTVRLTRTITSRGRYRFRIFPSASFRSWEISMPTTFWPFNDFSLGILSRLYSTRQRNSTSPSTHAKSKVLWLDSELSKMGASPPLSNTPSIVLITWSLLCSIGCWVLELACHMLVSRLINLFVRGSFLGHVGCRSIIRMTALLNSPLKIT